MDQLNTNNFLRKSSSGEELNTVLTSEQAPGQGSGVVTTGVTQENGSRPEGLEDSPPMTGVSESSEGSFIKNIEKSVVAEIKVLEQKEEPHLENYDYLSNLHPQLSQDLVNDFHRREQALINEENELEAQQKKKAVSLQLAPKDLYTCIAKKDKTDNEIIQLNLNGSRAKQNKDNQNAIAYFQEAALYRSWKAMSCLGEIYEEENHLYRAYLWYILAFQTYWLEIFKPSANIKNKLINICKKNNCLKNQLAYLNNIDNELNFFSCYPDSSQKEIRFLLMKLVIDYSRGLHEPYLSEAEQKNKAYWLNLILLESFVLDPKCRWGIGDKYKEFQFYSLAAASYEKSNLPEALYNLGILYETGKLDGSPNYEHAAYYYEKSNLPQGLLILGKLYEEYKLGEEKKYEKAAYYYEKSGNPEAYYKLGNLYYNGALGTENQYYKAKYYYEKSGSSEALYCLGVLYGEETLGHNADHKKSMEYYLKSETAKAFYNLGCLYSEGKISGKPDYQTALKYYEQSNSSEAFDNIACMYAQGKIGEKPDYQEAAKYYTKSNTPGALCQLGNFYLQGNLGEPDYQEAANYYTQSKTPGALLTLGQLYEYGYLTQIPDYKQAAEYYKQSKTPQALLNLGRLYLNQKLDQRINYQEVKKYFEESKTSEALCLLGHLYAQGFLSKDKKPNYSEAAKCYKQSRDPNALFNLAQFYEQGFLGGTPNYSEALKYYEESDHPYKDWLIINLYRNQNACMELAKSDFNLADEISIRKELITQKCQDLEDTSGEKSFLLGCLCLENREWESAFIHFSHALSQGEERAKGFLDNLEKKFEEPEITNQKNLLNVVRDVASKSDRIVKPKAKGSISNTKIKLTHKSYNTKEDKKKEQSRRNVELLSNSIRTSQNNKEGKNFNFYYYEFLDEKSRQEFNEFKRYNQKIKELLNDIQNKPWAANGTGKPEVLKYGIKIGNTIYKGCLSRHITDEDRLVYKITKERTILILSWKGHYTS